MYNAATRALVATLTLVAAITAGLAPAATAAETRTISGVVTLPGGQDSHALDALYVAYALEGTTKYTSVNVAGDGTFSIAGLAPGRYHVCGWTGSYIDAQGVFVDRPYNVLNTCFNTATYFGTRGALDVTSGDLAGQTLAMQWGRTISGRLSVGAGANPDWLGGVEVTAGQELGGDYGRWTGRVDPATGAFTVAGLYPGAHDLWFSVDEYEDPATGATVVSQLAESTYPSKVDVTGGNVTGIAATLAYAPVTGIFTTVPTPFVTGSPIVGGTLTANTGPWTPAATGLTYQWLRRGAPISGATGKTYVVQAADLGTYVQVAVTGSASGVTNATGTSDWTSIRDVFTTVPTPAVSGTPAPGSTLTCAPGTWLPAPNTITYRWLRGELPITGATSTTYVIQAADGGKQLRCEAFASRTSVGGVISTSLPLTVWQNFTSPGTVSIAGAQGLGKTLTASVSGSSPVYGEVTYTWLRNGTAIPSATGASYVLTAADSGATIKVQAVVKRSGYVDANATAAQQAMATFFTSTPAPVINGTVAKNATLTASTPAWTPSASLAYQWLRNGSEIASATSTSYSLTAADEGTAIAVRVTGSRASYAPVSVTSTDVAVPYFFAVSPTPTIVGTTGTGNTLLAVPGTWDPAPSQTTVTWRINGTVVATDSSTYQINDSDLGKSITATIVASKPGYASVTRTSEPLALPVGAFTTAPTPTIYGSVGVGFTLGADAHSWAPNPTLLSYQWLRNGSAIAGATDALYVPTLDDAGKSVAVRVTGTRTGHTTAQRTSDAVSVPLVLFGAAPLPTIVGDQQLGATWAATPGAWSPSPALAYQWLRNGVAIAGATEPTYETTLADSGVALSVRVTGTKPGYAPAVRTSAPTTLVRFFGASPAPTIAGSATQGSTLTADAGVWTPTPDFSYQWFRNGEPIGGATGSTYLVAAADLGTAVSVGVTGTLAGFATATRQSDSVSVASLFTSAPTPSISGTLRAGFTVTAKPGTWTPSATSYSYRWYRNGVAISGATASKYKLTATDRGKKITVKVTGKKAGYASTTKTSAAKYVPKVFTKALTPTITGTAKAGKTLTAHRGTWSPTPTYSYQWYRNGFKITNATKYQYKVTSLDKGKKITVKVTGKKTGYATITKTSASKSIAR